MSKSLRTTVLPPSPASGAVTWDALRPYLATVAREMLAPMDVRSDINDFAGGLYQAGDGRLIVGADAGLAGRPSSSLPTVLARVGDSGRASTPLFFPITQTGGLTSSQDVGPVSAESTALEAEISIASFTVQHFDRLVSYNSGTISGLSPNQNYRVYCEDENYLGGAVSYLATTNPQIPTAGPNRVFVGAVRTTVALTVATISSASSANPISFGTTAPHGWNTGNTVTFAGLPGNFGSALNGTGVYTITRTGASSFTVPVDGSAFAAYTSGGTVTRQTSTAISGQGGPSGWVDMAFLAQF
jgi:hypothetical protein